MGLFLGQLQSADGSIFQSCCHTPRTNEVEVPPPGGGAMSRAKVYCGNKLFSLRHRTNPRDSCVHTNIVGLFYDAGYKLCTMVFLSLED